MTAARRQRHFAHALGVLSAVILISAVAALLVDYNDGRGRRPAEQETIAALEVAVRDDASRAEALDAEYARIRDETLARERRFGAYSAAIIVSAAVLLIAAKWYRVKGKERSPTFAEIATHRGDARAIGRRAACATPGAPATTTEEPTVDLAFVDRLIDEFGTSPEAAIPILQRVQEHYRYLPDEALARVCELTEITPAQIAGVSSFYARFRRSPAGRWIVRVCHGTACHVAGATPITEEVRRTLGIAADVDTDPRREFTVDEVACLGCCSLAPVLTIEGETSGRLGPAEACAALDTFREEHGE